MKKYWFRSQHSKDAKVRKSQSDDHDEERHTEKVSSKSSQGPRHSFSVDRQYSSSRHNGAKRSSSSCRETELLKKVEGDSWHLERGRGGGGDEGGGREMNSPAKSKWKNVANYINVR